MNSIIRPDHRTRIYGVPTKARETKRTGTQGSSFVDMAASSAGAAKAGPGAPNADAYMEHLKKKYGHVTIQSVGKDQASLQKAGGRMNGSSVVIAPNILEDMANDPKKAVYYEQKIDYFFNTVIPQGNAICAARGLVFEPCGVVVHEDGTVTYICGCSDSPERVAEVNRINAEKARKKAEQRRLYQERSTEAAAQRRAIWARTAETAAQEKTFSSIGDLLKTRVVSAPAVAPEVSLPAEVGMFFLSL